ncbi:RNA-directed DNA polymerase (Reverse transcriptase) [Acidithiobacillus ferrooxidans ATCC 53993]|uniref:retron St85 family RNA-directed DNA polymerase n=1 Tax=Acidithiobacillus ferrooxidans TaxID=920 RepID=UPI00017F6DD5|nr:retron St85 family RNA-directed DNA polymerase [Acidithiobacillus ferrooxidans]ACH82547.1 RNA-directed DNA polymerase (Reverse transcriptase) [Acidithiobacillus ferrooxidans ATCC 53993]MBU2807759.1 RNA-directed DNA polymerase [Acidithiobacillus ferrooxidans F221]
MSIVTEPLFQRLLAWSPFSEHELVVLIATAPSRYKAYYIEKRGGRGQREISQPTKEIKFLQRLLASKELRELPIHDVAVGYRSGRSILDHAQPHASARYLLKLDFTNFFPSLKSKALDHRLSRDTAYSTAERWILRNLLCRRTPGTGNYQLSIGAPSSPHISNYLLCEFDQLMSDYCGIRVVRYTRYADDLAFSTSIPSVLNDIETEVRRLIQELDYLGLSLNEAKTINVSTKHRRTLVGLTLSNDGRASIGRIAKRELRQAIHSLRHGLLSQSEIANLRGRLAFTYAIDPEFIEHLLHRYGFESISTIDGPQTD